MQEPVPERTSDRPLADRHFLSGDFDVETEIVDGSSLLRLHGELDLASADRLSDDLEAVFDAQPAAVVLDLANLTFVDSTGIQVFLQAGRRAASSGCTFMLEAPCDRVLKILQLIGVEELATGGAGSPSSVRP